MMEKSHYLFRVSQTLQSVFPQDVAGNILEALLNTLYEHQQHVLLTWYRGWNSPKPDTYQCPEHIWRRMTLSDQHRFMSYTDGFLLQWHEDAGWDTADFDRYREWLKKNDQENDELMPRVDDFCTK